MKRTKNLGNSTEKSHRVVFFDCVRILCIAIIVYSHSQLTVNTVFNSLFFSDGQNFFNIYINGITGLAVYGVIFISGAVLQYSYKSIKNSHEYGQFLVKRFIRLYPAFWMSMILGVFLFPSVVIQMGILPILFEFTGFYVILGHGSGIINAMGWFIATIVLLYTFFPYISKFVKKYHIYAILLFLIVSLFSRYLFVSYPLVPLLNFYRWFPLCNLFEFGLGIYIVQNKFYPENIREYPRIGFLAELSFYVFLFHTVIIGALMPLLPKTGPASLVVAISVVSYFATLGIVLLVSWIAMILDKKVQYYLLHQKKIEGYLKS